jgi:hypothetical protein
MIRPDITPGSLPNPQEPVGAERISSPGRGFRRFGERVHAKLEEWKAIGIGRELGAPHNRPVDSRTPVDLDVYTSMVYAIPMTGDRVSGQDQRVLLVLPRRDTFDLLIVRPLQSQAEFPWDREVEDKQFLTFFDTFFVPSDTPGVLGDWQPQPDESTRDSFMNNIDLFPVEVVSEPTTLQEKRIILQETIAAAMIRRELQVVQQILTEGGMPDGVYGHLNKAS